MTHIDYAHRSKTLILLGETVGYMWPAARAYDKDAYEKLINAVYAGNPVAKDWLEANHKLKWHRSDFDSNIKCDYVTLKFSIIGSKI
jgi:hypothetical protein